MDDINNEEPTPNEELPDADETVDEAADADEQVEAAAPPQFTIRSEADDIDVTREVDVTREAEVPEGPQDDVTTEVEPDETVDATDPVVDAEPAAAFVPPMPQAPQQSVPQYDRLTRDPTATFGGVLSGIAHRYGWDVSLTRLAFVVLLIVSGGTAILAYLLSWIIIPRATHWPPPRVRGSRPNLSGRDLGIGLIGLGALVVLGIGSGEAAAVLVPLALVGGGIWLLLQNPREDEAPPMTTPAAAPPVVTYAAAAPTNMSQTPTTPAGVTMPQSPPQPYPTVVPAPVPKRSRLRRFGLIGLFGFLGLLLLTLIAVPLLLFALVFGGDFEFDGDNEYFYQPATVEEIPPFISEDAGEIRLDLRLVDFESISDDDEPIRVDIDLDLGRIEVLLPEDVRVDVDAETDLGDVTVFGSSSDGINPSRVFSDNDPQLDLDLDLNVGEIVVNRGRAFSSTTIEIN